MCLLCMMYHMYLVWSRWTHDFDNVDKVFNFPRSIPLYSYSSLKVCGMNMHFQRSFIQKPRSRNVDAQPNSLDQQVCSPPSSHIKHTIWAKRRKKGINFVEDHGKNELKNGQKRGESEI